MASYSFPKDGRLHTRYTELKRCTPGQIHSVVYDRIHGVKGFQNHYTMMGQKWHEYFERVSKETGFTPEMFDDVMGGALPVTHAEHEVCNELWDGICLWSTIDAVGHNPDINQGYILDYKTTINADKAKTVDKRQVAIYALQLRHQGIEIQRAGYLFMLMDPETGKSIETLEPLWITITEEMMEEAYQWLEPRVTLLRDYLTANSAQ